jgi:hypothetical protein
MIGSSTLHQRRLFPFAQEEAALNLPERQTKWLL